MKQSKTINRLLAAALTVMLTAGALAGCTCHLPVIITIRGFLNWPMLSSKRGYTCAADVLSVGTQHWNVIEKLTQTVSGHEDAWYASNIEIFDYITAYRQLCFGVDMQFVEKPTYRDLYFSWLEKNRVVQAGQTVFL